MLLESDKLVHHILSDLHTTKKKKSRVILRMLPVRSWNPIKRSFQITEV